MPYRVPLLAMLLMSVAALTPAVARADAHVPRFEPAPCPFDVPDYENIDCGYLVVPERHAEPDGPTIRLAVAILRSLSDSPEPDPVIYLEGGPGGGALDSWDHWINTPFRERRDFILIDQRGTGYSQPELHCEEFDQLTSDTLDDLLTDEEILELTEETSLDCRDRLRDEGINLEVYTSAERAADIAALRVALGYDEVNLYGISYGTRLAQTIMRDHPEGIRSVILDSTVALRVNAYEQGATIAARAFGELFEGCAAADECSAAFPTLEADFYDFVQRANKEPFRIPVTDPYTGQRVRAWMRGMDVLYLLFDALYDSSVIPFLPLILDRAAHGDYRLLAAYANINLKFNAESDFAIGMYYSVECYEELPFNDYGIAQEISEQSPDLHGLLINDTDFTVCPQWGVEAPPPVENEPVESDIPTLVVAGEYDPITPPEWGRLASETLPNSQFVEFPGLGHGATIDECAESVAVAFVDDPQGEPPTNCIGEMEDGPEFVTGLAPVRGIYPLLEALLLDTDALQYLIIAGSVLIFGSAGTVWPLLRLIHYYRRKPERASARVQAAGWVAFLLGGWNLMFLLSLAIVSIMVVAENEVLLLFGLPTWAAPLALMPHVSIGLTALMLILTIPVWAERFWGITGRLYYGLLSLANVAFAVWLGWWGLIGWPF